MKRKLNLIVSAASLVLLGFPATSNAFQHPTTSPVGSGVIVSDPAANFGKPLEMPRSRWTFVKDRVQQASAMESVANESGALIPPLPPIVKNKLDSSLEVSRSILLPPKENLPPIVGGSKTAASNPPIVKGSTRRATDVPPIVRKQAAPTQANTSERYVVKSPPIVQAPASMTQGAKSTSDYPVRTAAVTQGSSTRSILPQGSSTRSALPQGSATRSALPQSSAAPSYYPQANDTQSVLPQDSSMQSMPYAETATPDYFLGGNGYNEAPVIGDPSCETCSPVVASDGACATCGSGMTDGVCPTCGPGAGYGNCPTIQDFGTFGSVSASRRYAHIEALFLTRDDGELSGPGIVPLTDFGTETGFRFTLGGKSDSVNGREISVFAVNGIDENVSIADSPLLSVDTQAQEKSSDLYSLEFNKVSYGWDLVKTFVGFRFIRFDDSYRVAASRGDRLPQPAQFDVFGNLIQPPLPGGAAASGLNTLDAANSLIGLHAGGELFYDIGYRWSASIAGKYGVFANFHDFDTNSFFSSGAPFSDESEDVDISTAAELNIFAHYQVRTNLRFKAGYNLIYVGNVVTVSDNFAPTLPNFGNIDVDDEGEAFFHGASFGIEIYR